MISHRATTFTLYTMLAKVADMLCSVQFEVEVQYAGHRGHGW